MTLKQTVSVLAVVVVVGVVAWGVSMIPHEATPMQQGQPQPQGQHVLQGTLGADHNYTHAESTDTYEIKATWSETAPLVVEQGLANVIAQFKTDNNLDHLTAADKQAQGLDGTRKYSLQMKYADYSAPGYHSYAYTVYQDTLGAHPNGFYLTFVFDDAGNQVQLADLFKPGVRYLDRLSAESYTLVSAELARRTGAKPDAQMLDTVRMGTEPSPEALQFWYLSGNDLHLLFPPYQVAAYAVGSFDVAIPLANLKDILK